MWKFDLPGFSSSDANSISMITLNIAEDDRDVHSEGNFISVSSTSSGGDLISACAMISNLGDSFVNIWSIVTSADDQNIDAEANFELNLQSNNINGCMGVSSSESSSYILL